MKVSGKLAPANFCSQGARLVDGAEVDKADEGRVKVVMVISCGKRQAAVERM
jgi:hypothetical protein